MKLNKQELQQLLISRAYAQGAHTDDQFRAALEALEAEKEYVWCNTELSDMTVGRGYEVLAEDGAQYCIRDDAGDIVVWDREYFDRKPPRSVVVNMSAIATPCDVKVGDAVSTADGPKTVKVKYVGGSRYFTEGKVYVGLQNKDGIAVVDDDGDLEVWDTTDFEVIS